MDFDRIKQIIETGHFWCSRFSELNDPMEGVFTIKNSRDAFKKIQDMYIDKIKYRICSFSGEQGFSYLPMWGYYSNGFKGVAIEVEVDNNDPSIKRISYVNSIQGLNTNWNNPVSVLTCKLVPWEHEDEYRFIVDSLSNYHKIGNITCVYFGDPYGNVVNKNIIVKQNNFLLDYREYRKNLIPFIHAKRIYHRNARIEGISVVV